MSILNGTILDAGTAVFSGGTSKTLTLAGKDIPNGVAVADFSVTDFRIRPKVEFRNSESKLSATGVYGKGSRQATVVIPKILANGTQGFPCIRIKLEDFPEMTTTEIDRLRSFASQLLLDADFTAFWQTGAVG